MSFADEYRTRVAVWSDVQYCMPRMLDTALRYEQVRVLELGVRSGNSTSAFLAAAEQVDGHVWSVDVDPPQVPQHWHESPLWTFIQGDDLAIESPAEAFDVLFIDTLHTYKHTMDELYRWAPRMADGGTILLHDTLLEHVDGEQGVFPVARALDKFRQLTGLPWVEHGGQYGLGEVSIPGA